jgi:hypothetical protein
MPVPSFQSVFVPAIVDPMVAVTPESTLILDGTPLILSVPAVIE